MKRYLRIYIQLLKLNLETLFAYRANFINHMIGSVGWGMMSLLTIILLTARVTHAYGWKREELLLLNGIYGTVIGIFHMFISVNMVRLSKVIHMGELDTILVKPIDSQFAVSLWNVNFAVILRIAMAAGFSVWVIRLLGVSISANEILIFVLLSVASLVLLYALWFFILTNLIWFSHLSNLSLFLFSFESMARFPKEMLAQLSVFIFITILPLGLAINTPMRALVGKLVVPDAILLLVLATIFWFMARKYWKFALRYYTSASG